jgi:hypothetical protein
LRHLLLADLVPIPDHRIGVKIAAIVKFDPTAQLEDSAVHIVLIHLP